MGKEAHLSLPVSVDLALRPEAIAEARGIVGRALNDHPRVEDAILAISELVTNVIRHAPQNHTATIVIEPVAPDTIRLSIRQALGTIGPSPAERGEGGHGLKIVEAVSSRWGVEGDEWSGVWFELTD
ncbi:MAG TPA: ATP-binding protein [Acidimicrobiia bacterium]|nr:ATP-binding protein [Acidimicrobiia bacterium]